jgi:hypothetical protein
VKVADSAVSGEAVVLAGSLLEEPEAFPPGVTGIGGFNPFGGNAGLLVHDVRGTKQPLVCPLPEGATVQALQLAQPADGKPVAFVLVKTESSGYLERIDLATGKGQKLAEPVSGLQLAVSRDGQTVVVQTSESSVRVWDMAADRPGRAIGEGEQTITALALSPDGRTLALAGSDRKVTLWDIATGKIVQQLDHPRTQHLLFSEDGRRLAAGSPEEVKVWAVE